MSWSYASTYSQRREFRSPSQAAVRARARILWSRLARRLRPLLVGHDSPDYTQLARDLRMTRGALQVALHRIRHRFGESLRSVIAETVENPDDVDEELRFLLAVFRR